MDHTATTTLTLTLTLPTALIEQLEATAKEQKRPLSKIMQDALETALVEADDDWEDSDEQILADLRESLENFKAGRTRNIRDIMADIRQGKITPAVFASSIM